MKTTPTRIYLVNVDDHGRHLVRAVSKAAALAHVMRAIASVGVASQEQLIECLGAGISVEAAGEVAAADGPEDGNA